MNIDPANLADLLREVGDQLERDVHDLVESHCIPGTAIVDDQAVRTEIQRLGMLTVRVVAYRNLLEAVAGK